jgi:AraC-like DNA-binding protein
MRAAEQRNRELLRARDRMDREFGRPLAVADVARTAHLSRAEFTRAFRAAFGSRPTATSSGAAWSARRNSCARRTRR